MSRNTCWFIIEIVILAILRVINKFDSIRFSPALVFQTLSRYTPISDRNTQLHLRLLTYRAGNQQLWISVEFHKWYCEFSAQMEHSRMQILQNELKNLSDVGYLDVVSNVPTIAKYDPSFKLQNIVKFGFKESHILKNFRTAFSFWNRKFLTFCISDQQESKC